MRLLHLSWITLLAPLCACQPASQAPAAAQTQPSAITSTSTAAASSAPAAEVLASSAVSPAAVPTKAKVVAPVSAPKHATTSTPAASPNVENKQPVTAVTAVDTTAEKSAPPATNPVASGKPSVRTTPVLAQTDALQLAGKSGCLACHSIERKIVGPAWRDVAAKYRGDGAAKNMLENKVAKGGKGSWGSMAMPANSPRVAETDIQALVGFILSLQ